MLKKVSRFFSGIFRPLAFAGVNSSLSADQRKTFILMNQVLLIAVMINFSAFIYYFFNHLFLSSLVNLITGSLFMAGIYFNYKQQFRLARIISVVSINFYLIVINIVEGRGAGEYLLYFPVFISVTFMVRIYKDYSELAIVYILTAIAAFICISFVPFKTDLQWIDEKTMEKIFASRLILSIILTIVISFLILRVNRDNETLIEEEKKFSESIYNTSLEGVFILQHDSGVIRDCNQRTIDLFGVGDKREIIGTEIDKWFEKRTADAVLDKKGNGITPWSGELTVLTKQMKLFYGFAASAPFSYKGKQYLKVSLLDRTDVKSAEFELIKAKEKAESMAKMKTRFLSNMSHELRTPLNGIIGVSNLLLQEELLPSQKSHFDILKFSSEHMLKLVNDVLDYTKMEAGKMELVKGHVNIRHFVERVITQFSNQIATKGLAFKTYIDPALNMDLITDETRLHQILSNLLSNAIKFTHRGSIMLTANKIMASSSKVTVQFMVQDTGIGIPENKRKEIFESFTQADVETTRKYGGTGLGLTITKELLSVFDSELVLRSEEGKGSQFIFMLELPVNESRKVYITEKTDLPLNALKGVRILVAEDNAVNMAIVKRFLKNWGIEISEAQNGRIAVDLFRKGEYDLLLFDLEMPEMDGAEALREIRKLDDAVPVMAFTAAVYENMQMDLKEKGFTDFIHKPFRPDDLHNKIAIHAKRA
jgi:signal transduction histidine kinase/CheY-like chemotaxis protein